MTRNNNSNRVDVLAPFLRMCMGVPDFDGPEYGQPFRDDGTEKVDYRLLVGSRGIIKGVGYDVYGSTSAVFEFLFPEDNGLEREIVAVSRAKVVAVDGSLTPRYLPGVQSVVLDDGIRRIALHGIGEHTLKLDQTVSRGETIGKMGTLSFDNLDKELRIYRGVRMTFFQRESPFNVNELIRPGNPSIVRMTNSSYGAPIGSLGNPRVFLGW
jgi:hypothetical protein